MLFQASIDTGYLPHDWRSANITPICKKGDRSDPSNYRPVSLTSMPSKILEHVIYRHLMTHLEANAILSDAQHGFRKGRSCETQLLLLLENLTKTLDNRQVDLILTDFSKAFGKVPRQRLLLKLKNFGVQGPILDWLTCFVTKRTQRVVLEGIKSEEVIVKSGVPQGTVLGPLLFLVFINDIHENVSSQLHLFADDCILYREVINIEDCNNLQRHISIICDWDLRLGIRIAMRIFCRIKTHSKCYIQDERYSVRHGPESLSSRPCTRQWSDLNWSIAPPFGTHTTRRTKPYSKEIKGEQLGL